MPLGESPIDRYLKSKGSPLYGMGSTFEAVGKQYGIDPRLIVSIAGAETSFGTYGPSQRIHNPFGMGPGINYGSYKEAIGAVGRNLRQNYFNQGLKTIPQIQGKWAPGGAANDPTDLNSNWTRNVSSYYHEQGGDPHVAAATAQYVAQAAEQEKKYATVGSTAKAAVQQPQLTAGQESGIMARVGAIMNPGLSAPTPLTRRGDQRKSLLDFSPPGMGGSNAIVNERMSKQMHDVMAKQLYGVGLGLETEGHRPVTAKAAEFTGNIAEYMQQHPQAAGVVKQSKSFLGDPYKWGGSSPKTGFDCSGFAQWLYHKQGIDLPRVTYDQVKAGKGVAAKNLAPGDLVFFGTKSNPHHEGIYIGNGQFIHAPHTGDVIKISDLTSGYYKDHFVTGRRVTR